MEQKTGLASFMIYSGHIAANAFKLATVERASTVFQTQNFNPRMVPLNIKYENFSQLMAYTVKNEGFGGIFRGVRATVIINILNGQLEKLINDPLSKLLGVDLTDDEADAQDLSSNVTNFSDGSSQNKTKEIAKNDQRKMSVIQKIFRKALGGTLVTGAGLLLLYALEYARIRVSADIVTDGHRYFSNTFLCIKKTVLSSGFFSLYTGYGMTLLGLFSYKFVDFGVKNAIKDHRQNASSRISRFFCKHLPGFLASLVVYPIYTVRNTMILQVGNPTHGIYFQNAAMCVKKIFTKFGLSGFYGGFWLSALFGILYREVLYTREKIIDQGKENAQNNQIATSN